MKMGTLILLPMFLVGCATERAPSVRVSARTVPGTLLPSEGIESVRYAENIRAYPIGRYIDPGNARIMHEGHTLYRVETSPRWNLHPNAATRVPRGPVQTVHDVSRTTTPVGEELMVELNRQRETTRAVIQGAETVSRKLDQLSTSVQETRQAAEQNVQMRRDLDNTLRRLQLVEDELRSQQRSEPGTVTTTTVDENSEW